MKNKLFASLIIASFMLSGCASQSYQHYAQAVKEQNSTTQLRMEQQARTKEIRDNKHEERMTVLTGTLMLNAAQTKTPNDDFMVPVVLMLMADKKDIAETLASTNTSNCGCMQQIKAPDSIGDTIRKSTGAVLGLAGITAGIMQSNNMKNVALGGIAGAGVHNSVSGEGNSVVNDSYKSGAQNTVTGAESAVTGGQTTDILTNGEESEEYEGTPECSVGSHAAGEC